MAEQKELYTHLNDIFRTDVPAIPLMYRPDELYDFNGVPMHGGAGIMNLRVIEPAAS